MATALVVRAQRYKKIGDKTSPLVYILKRNRATRRCMI